MQILNIPFLPLLAQADGGLIEEIEEEDDFALHCICLQPWNDRFMIQCDQCDCWFHGECVNIAPEEAELIDLYNCLDCEKQKKRRSGKSSK